MSEKASVFLTFHLAADFLGAQLTVRKSVSFSDISPAKEKRLGADLLRDYVLLDF